jgi:hypothetical protein
VNIYPYILLWHFSFKLTFPGCVGFSLVPFVTVLDASCSWSRPSFRMSRRVALVRTGVSEERRAYIIKVTKIGELGTTLGVTSNNAHYQNKCCVLRRMPSSGMLRHVALVRTGVSEERSAYIIMVTKIGELGRTLAITSNRRTLPFSRMLRRVALRSSETSILTRATRCNIREDCFIVTAVEISDLTSM